MALSGDGIDRTFKAGSSLRTTTSQYMVVGIEPTSTSADHTVYIAGAGSTPASSITSRYAIGINQTYMSSSSEECTVRMHGVSKAVCANSISVGSPVVAYEGASTTTRRGQIAAQAFADLGGAETLTTDYKVILGRALEDGSTGTTISILLQPAFNALVTNL